MEALGEAEQMIADVWNRPATIERNRFVHKSLSCWSYNIAVGCNHACRFCYVPDASTNKLAGKLAPLGVSDPDAQWGDYVFVRDWDGDAFVRSLMKAEAEKDLNPDGNRAVMMCTTTDPYQTISGNPKAGYLNSQLELLMNAALHLILERSTLNVRILTRSPLARQHFPIFKKFGKRLLFGMSLPTLNNKLARIYEPKAPAPAKRLETLRAAKSAGLNVFVALAPVYPDCDAEDMNATLRAVRELNPVTVFMEPINIRAENVRRIEEHARGEGIALRTDVFATTEAWRHYAYNQMLAFEDIATSLDFEHSQIHLWPDASLGAKDAIKQFRDLRPWLDRHWNKISAWPC